jgi:hypothetical protein
MSEQVKLTDITIPTRRHRKQHDPERLANSMREVGLLQPIVLTGEKVLVAGLHRLRAAELLKWETITAEFVSGDELEAELAEIDENLMREQLTVHEQSEHIARREQIMRARGERAMRGGQLGNKNASKNEPATVTGSSEKTTKELAAELGVSESTYQKRSKIGRGLTEETKEILSELDPKDCDLPNSTRQLNYLASVNDPEDQVEIATRVGGGEAVSVWQASNQLKAERGEITQAELYQLAMHSSIKDEAERKRSEEPIYIERIRKAGKMEYVVQWSDGSANRVQRSFLLQEHDFKKCRHCSGYGVRPGRMFFSPRPHQIQQN